MMKESVVWGLVGLGALIAGLSGIPSLFLTTRRNFGLKVHAILMAIASLTGLAGSFWALLIGFQGNIGTWGGQTARFWGGSSGGGFLALDPLGAFFLVPVFLVSGLGAIYNVGYHKEGGTWSGAKQIGLFWGLAVLGLCLLIVARNGLIFLAGWEIMALSGFFLIVSPDTTKESQSAARLYFIATHLSTLLLFFLFLLWKDVSGSFDLAPLSAQTAAASPATLQLLFFVALVAFGLKAGIMPLHFWLPKAHAAAPSPVSALLSGVFLKMGVYGLIRFLSLIPHPPPLWGGIVLALGAASGLFGVVLALTQHDLKRLLAYHSVENIGIILMGFGMALLGRALNQPVWVGLGLAGALLHVWNHSLFKSLLFFGAGSVVRATGKRRIDALGGLARFLPWTAALFFLGATAICGLPPLNGFVSEFLVYLGAFNALAGGTAGSLAALATAPVLAMIGALALACFVKVSGMIFLGSPREKSDQPPRESPPSMIGAMLVLALACATIGVLPALIGPLLNGVVSFAGFTPLEANSQSLSIPVLLDSLTEATAGLAVLLVLTGLGLFFWRRSHKAPTWDCGYVQPSARMQYTAGSFSRPLRKLFGWFVKEPTPLSPLEGAYPVSDHGGVRTDHRFLVVLQRAARSLTKRLKGFQQGMTQQYVLYILIAALGILATQVPYLQIVKALFGGF